ncbi:hypothetical protein N9772_01125 [Bacteroidia bacterium]|nr:hypothetical protein [Bacteroidia bacterium]
MNNKKIILSLLFSGLTTVGFSQFTFSVSPGLGLNTAQVGYKVNPKIVPFFGFQYATGSLTQIDSYEEYDRDRGTIVQVKDEVKGNGGIFLPNLGVKYFLLQKEKVSTYALTSFSLPIITGKVTDSDGEVIRLSDELDKFGVWGAELGFGAEYFFDKNFSLGGEFGVRYISAKAEQSFDDSVFNPNTGSNIPSESTTSFAAALNPTYSKISLNFYF